jgi:hypothetical protein
MMPRVKLVTIANGASLSGATYIGDGKLTGIQMPATWTAANLSFQGSHDGVTYCDIYDSAGTEVIVAAAASVTIPLDDFRAALWIKVRSGPTGAAVNQGAARVISLLTHAAVVGTTR